MTWWMRWLAIIGAVTALVLTYNWRIAAAERHGADLNQAKWGQREDKIRAEVAGKYADDLASALKQTTQLQAQVNTLTATRTAMEQSHEKELNSARADVRSGAERLRNATRTTCPVLREATSGAAANSAGPAEPQGADILPEMAAELVGIAGATAKDVRDYNALYTYTVMILNACQGERHGQEAQAGPGDVQGLQVLRPEQN